MSDAPAPTPPNTPATAEGLSEKHACVKIEELCLEVRAAESKEPPNKMHVQLLLAQLEKMRMDYYMFWLNDVRVGI